jgi:hypothetical protein
MLLKKEDYYDKEKVDLKLDALIRKEQQLQLIKFMIQKISQV